LEVDPSSQHFETKEHAMLVLSRKLNEKIVIDGGIVVTVVKIDRNQVRLGIEAPPNVRIFREEIVVAEGTASAERPVGAGV
jgi:carbon storage regulator